MKALDQITSNSAPSSKLVQPSTEAHRGWIVTFTPAISRNAPSDQPGVRAEIVRKALGSTGGCSG
jgi:hypothetical protein